MDVINGTDVIDGITFRAAKQVPLSNKDKEKQQEHHFIKVASRFLG